MEENLKALGINPRGGNNLIRRAINAMFVHLDFTYPSISEGAMIAFLLKAQRVNLIDEAVTSMKAAYQGDLDRRDGVGYIMIRKEDEFWRKQGA